MSAMKSKTCWLIGLVLAQIVVASACVNPNKLPGVSAIAEREAERAHKEADEAIKNSPALQELDTLCSQQVPALGFTRLYRRLDRSGGRLTVSQSYHSDANFATVKQEYKNQLAPAGWRVTVEEDVSRAESRIEFARDGYTMKIYNVPSAKEANYVVYCEKVQVKQ